MGNDKKKTDWATRGIYYQRFLSAIKPGLVSSWGPNPFNGRADNLGLRADGAKSCQKG